jgi:nicotinamide mononucleotide transporter
MDLYQKLLADIPLSGLVHGAPPTSAMELIAVVFTILSVAGATKLKISQYPVGIIGTIFYSFVFLNAKLYSSLALNVYFTVIQLYGWWYWMYGARKPAVVDYDAGGAGVEVQAAFRTKPPIGDWPWKVVAVWGLVAVALSVLVGNTVARYLHGSSALLDAAILSASVLAQFLLDRKQIKSWFVWMVVNVLSIIVYSEQKLVVSGVLYAALLVNAVYGYWNWRKQMRAKGPPGLMVEVWDKGTRV